ncbi:glycosyltransferase [Flavihumibacter sp. UBA7668]|uniref:glycosyltransferase n=1 Tax=Flavihumibacter sp. UBA7668 TaxID=1946542 RepID=UPI0025C3F99F|nr:glycosyltransferase [Flavihumibacter sp. UBA7668]
MTRVAILLEATLGGTRKHVIDLLLHLPLDIVSPVFIYSKERADRSFFTDIVKVQDRGIPCIELPMSNNIVKPENLLCIFRLTSIFRECKIEVLHLHGAIAGTIGRISALLYGRIRKIYYSPHGGVLHKLKKASGGTIFRTIEKILIRKNVEFIAVSSDEVNSLKNELGLTGEKIHLIHNGISFDRIAADRKEVRNRLGFSDYDYITLYPALFLEAKGHLNFFTTLLNMPTPAIDPRVKIVLAGDGPLKEKVMNLVAASEYANSVKFAGFVEKIEEYFLACDIVLLPSNQEAFGYVLVEALLYNRPVLATNVGGIPDIIKDGLNGFLYPVDQLNRMINDINRLAGSANDMEQLVVNIEGLLQEKFDIRKNTQAIASLYI